MTTKGMHLKHAMAVARRLPPPHVFFILNLATRLQLRDLPLRGTGAFRDSRCLTHFTGKNSALSPENTYFWDDISLISTGYLGPTPIESATKEEQL
ncbi:MAG: hypothetical protein C0399_13300, partial [Syntrophus sp. (in: bacteria)]|nr:hypothetical protein [Syntrophus sp. (in: bacteria)]